MINMAKYKKRKDGRYYTLISDGYKPDGSRNRIPVYGKTISELEENKLQLQMKIRQGIPIKDSNVTLEEYANNWFETYKSNARTNTKKNYSFCLKKHIIPALGYLPLNKVVKSDIQGLINEHFHQYATCHYIIVTLRQIFDTALDDDLIMKNPCFKVKLPKKNQAEKRPLSDIEKEALKTAALSDQEQAYINIVLYCGLSRAESLALSRHDVDLKKKLVHVHNDLVFSHNQPLIEDVKNDYRRRDVPIPDVAIPFLTDYLKSLDGIYLFTKKDGSMITEQSYRHMWDNIRKKCNDAVCSENELKMHVEKVTFTSYTFRHNYATQLYYSGITIKQAAKYMGHCDTKMIMEIYSHLDEQKENAVNKINAVNFL